MKYVLKWIKGVFKHPLTILKGNYYRLFKSKQQLFEIRYNKCKRCDQIENTIIGQVCGLCGCPLDSKLRVKEEQCEMFKW